MNNQVKHFIFRTKFINFLINLEFSYNFIYYDYYDFIHFSKFGKEIFKTW